MCSIHKCIVLGIGLFLVAGCQQSWTKPQAVNETPLIIDEAMQLRQWPQTAVYYPSHGVVAGPVWGLPWREQTYRGVVWEPTFTAQPPLEVIPYEDRVTNAY